MKFTARRSIGLFALVMSLIAAGAAHAARDEIIVTSRKFEENVQDVPISVSPFTAQDIRERNLRNIDDIALFTPGFSFTSAFGRQPGSDRPTIRGISTIQNGVANASSAAYFVDGVFLGGSPQSTELFNIERVEVLKGPQAAQFGRGTYVGAINYITKRPTDELEAEIEFAAGQDGYFSGIGSVSGPISDTASYYLAVGADTFDGQYTNQRTGEDLGGEESLNFTGKLFWNPTDEFDVTLKLGYQETEDDHFAMYLQARGLNNCCFRGDAGSGIAPRAREYYIGDAVADWDNINLFTDILDQTGGSGTELERTLAALTINWEFADGMTLSSLTGYVDDEVTTAFDVSYAAYEPFNVFIPGIVDLRGAFNQRDIDEQSDFSQELRLTFTNIENFRITGGLYYYEGETEEIQDQFIREDASIVPGIAGSSANPFSGDTTLVVEEIENIAVFGGVDWDVTDQLTLGFEARYAEDDIKVFDKVATGGCTAATCSETFESFTPRFTARYAITDAVNIYGNIAKGTKPGNFNSLVPDIDGDGNPDENLRAVDEEEALNYEIGVKSTVLDGRATLNVAAYLLDVTDQQLTRVIELPGGFTTSILANVGETEVWGIEFDSAISVTDELSVAVTYAWTDAEITERISTDQADLFGWDGDPATLAQFGNVAGQDAPRSPEHQFSIATRYERPFGGFFGNGNANWFISADLAYEDSKFSQEHNLIETGDRTLVGLQLGFVDGPWEFKIWGKNIFDDDTPVDILRYIDRRSGPLTGCSTVDPGNPFCGGVSTSPRGFALTAPRQDQWGATVNYRFGANR